MTKEAKKIKADKASADNIKGRAKTVSLEKKPLPSLRSGQLVIVRQKVIEGAKERVQSFEGTIISLKGKTDADRTITVRRFNQGFGVERIFPLASPHVLEIQILKERNVRQAKLYHLRQLRAKPLKEKKAD
ncbi:MAG: 50S ribosomal protein L19 [Patescibacteria group bacterium]